MIQDVLAKDRTNHHEICAKDVELSIASVAGFDSRAAGEVAWRLEKVSVNVFADDRVVCMSKR